MTFITKTREKQNYCKMNISAKFASLANKQLQKSRKQRITFIKQQSNKMCISRKIASESELCMYGRV